MKIFLSLVWRFKRAFLKLHYVQEYPALSIGPLKSYFSTFISAEAIRKEWAFLWWEGKKTKFLIRRNNLGLSLNFTICENIPLFKYWSTQSQKIYSDSGYPYLGNYRSLLRRHPGKAGIRVKRTL
jgi:hypothetical protein